MHAEAAKQQSEHSERADAAQATHDTGQNDRNGDSDNRDPNTTKPMQGRDAQGRAGKRTPHSSGRQTARTVSTSGRNTGGRAAFKPVTRNSSPGKERHSPRIIATPGQERNAARVLAQANGRIAASERSEQRAGE